MRALVLIAITAAAMAGCNRDAATQGNESGPRMTAEAINSNDITAIDAVTGEAANMAEDIEYDVNSLNSDGNAVGNATSGSTRTSSRRSSPSASSSSRASAPPPTQQPEAAPEPATEGE